LTVEEVSGEVLSNNHPHAGRESAAFLGPPGRQILCYSYEPTTELRGSVVICPPLFSDFSQYYRLEVRLARELVANGFSVRRFHYLGTGHSDALADPTLESMVQDGGLVVTDASAPPIVAFVGTRWGALVAARLSIRQPDSTRLILWEPVLDPRQFFVEAFRARMIRGLKAGMPSLTPDAAFDRLQATGLFDVLGWPVNRRLVEDSIHTNLRELLLFGHIPRSLLLFQVASSNSLRTEYTELAQALSEGGWDVNTHVAVSRQPWWFANDQDQDAVPLRDIVETTVALLLGGVPRLSRSHGRSRTSD
jgi:pimeloyl-ACP methyl ester carboxylesterase